MLTGVVGGLAEALRIDPLTARLLVLILGLAGGVGLVGYLVAWWVSTEPATGSEVPARPALPRRTVAAGAVTLGVLLLLRGMGFWPGDAVMLPTGVAAGGAILLARRGHPADAERTRQVTAGAVDLVFSGGISLWRLVAGGVLVTAAVFSLSGVQSLDQVMRAAQSVGLALAGMTVVLGPWIGRLLEQLNTERRERIRSEERAAMAAHLHDSVLQTLALIQRTPNEPRRMVRLARRQERELRAWLYGDQHAAAGPGSLAGAVERLAAEVEGDHDVRVEVVTVGDHPLDERARTLLGAVREATVNAAKHAGVDAIAVYLEAEEHLLSAFVRDRGRGFDPALVPADRHGIAGSIVGRLERAGGHAALLSSPGEGTEVQLYVPLVGAAAHVGNGR